MIENRPDLRWRRLWWGLGLAYCAVVLWGSLLPLERAQQVPASDLLQHLVGYGAMGYWFGQLTYRLGWLLTGLCTYGATIEVLQPLLSDRFFAWDDLAANTMGAALGIWLAQTPLGRVIACLDGGLARRT